MKSPSTENYSPEQISKEIAHWRQSILEVSAAISSKATSRLQAEIRFDKMLQKSETLAADLKKALSEDRNLDALNISMRLAHAHLGCKLLDRELVNNAALNDLYLTFQKGAIDQTVDLEKYLLISSVKTDGIAENLEILQQKIDSNQKHLNQLAIEAGLFNSTNTSQPVRCLHQFFSEGRLKEFAEDLVMRVRRGLPVCYMPDQNAIV